MASSSHQTFLNTSLELNPTSLPQQSEQIDNDYPILVKMLSGIIDAIWEQSETSDLNASPWNRIGAISKYCCSIYGLSCLVMALILNRTLVMASTNNVHSQQTMINRIRNRNGNRSLNDNDMQSYGLLYTLKSVQSLVQSWDLVPKFSIFVFRIFVVIILLYQAFNVLVVINLQFKLGTMNSLSLTYFYKILSNFSIFDYDVLKFDSSKYMRTPSDQVMIGPTSDIYWPIFLTFCLSSFVETFITSIQGKKPYTESGITIFEHSLAFQEFSSNAAFFFSNSKFHKRPSEQIMITTLFSILNHLNIHIGSILNDNRYRLIPSSVIGLGFLAYFIDSILNKTLFQFPFILILTFTPQVLILAVIFISLIIFILAFIVNGIKLEGLNYASFFLHDDQINEDREDQFSQDSAEEESNFIFKNLNVNFNDDFYTALLNTGILAITSAGKSSYITELSLVVLDSETWIERDIWNSMKSVLCKKEIDKDSSKTFQGPMEYIDYTINANGYDNMIEKPGENLISRPISYNDNSVESLSLDFCSADRESTRKNKFSVIKTRFLYVKEMLIDLAQLIYGLIVHKIISTFITKFKIKILRIDATSTIEKFQPGVETDTDFERRKLTVPPFLRRFMIKRNSLDIGDGKESKEDEITVQKLINSDNRLNGEIELNYAKLLFGGNECSEEDDSADYQIAAEYISDSDFEETDIELDLDVIDHHACNTLEKAAPILELFDEEGLMELFTNSSNSFDILQQHLTSPRPGPLTRSRYRSTQNTLSPSHQKSSSRDKQELNLLNLLVSKRLEKNIQDKSHSRSLECVICQINTREIITWPCKCFAICETCRLSLVSKNIEGCVCCRRQVKGVSKIFIP